MLVVRPLLEHVLLCWQRENEWLGPVDAMIIVKILLRTKNRRPLGRLAYFTRQFVVSPQKRITSRRGCYRELGRNERGLARGQPALYERICKYIRNFATMTWFRRGDKLAPEVSRQTQNQPYDDEDPGLVAGIHTMRPLVNNAADGISIM